MAVLVGGGSLIAATAAAGAYEPVGADFRISNIGTDGDADRDGFNPAVAYNATADEYLVTWLADGFATADEFEVFGQRVSAAGAELGTDFRISNVGTDGDAARNPSNPAVAYSETANEYLVTWSGDGLATNDEDEVFGQRVSAAGAELGTDFRISNVGADLDAARDASDPAVAYNAIANEYLVTWSGAGLAAANEDEVFGQRISAAGAELGADFRISNVGTDADADRDGTSPAVAYSQTANEYLVTWSGDGLAIDNEDEVFGQRLSAAGAELGVDFRISTVGTDLDAARDASIPAVAYNAIANEYLVTWKADGLATDNEFEVFGQRISAAGAELGVDFRISTVGTDLDAAREASSPAVAYSQTANEYLVTWSGDGLATDNEDEVFGQRISAAGAELGVDFRISTVGTDGDAARRGISPAVAYNATANEYLVTSSDDGLATDNENEIFGRRLAPPATPPTDRDPDPGPSVADTDPPETTITKGPKKKLNKSKAKLRFVSDEASSSFECRLIGKHVKAKLKKFNPCSSPAKYKRLELGKKRFEVRATDATGNTDPTPASRSWKVKQIATG